MAKNGGNKVLLTTHSPYILGTINNLLYANKISKEVNNNTLGEIIDSYKWLEFGKISAYYVECGDIQVCSDNEFEAINNEIRQLLFQGTVEILENIVQQILKENLN